MSGDYHARLEQKLTELWFNFDIAYRMGDYVQACTWLYWINASYPSRIHLSNMPVFQLRSNSLRSKLNMTQKAKNYCDYWRPLLEIGMTDYREDNQAKYNRV